MGTIIQFEMFDGDDLAIIYAGKRWYKVPLWVWLEVEGDGIRCLIQHWQGGLLMKYYPPEVVKMIEMGTALPDVENEVFTTIRRDAKALQRYLRGKYRDTLSSVEKRALSLELECLEYRKLTGFARYEWIAQQMSGRRERYSARSVQSILENVSYVLRAAYEDEIQTKLKKWSRAVREVWIEYSNLSNHAA